MTSRERFIRCALNQEIDRVPFLFYFGPWGETIEEWRKQGITDPNAWCNPALGFDPPILNLSGCINLMYLPGYEFKVLEDKGERYVYQDGAGILAEAIKGKSGIPKILRNPVTGWDDWETIKAERLNPDSAERISDQLGNWIAYAKTQDSPIQIGTYPYGLFGTLRDMIGVEELCILFYEDPELIHAMMDYLTDFWLCLYEKVASQIQIDMIHIWEDMSGKSGSLLSPAMVREFMLPNYRKIKEFGIRHAIPIMAVDTDGICDELIPLFEEAGVNLMMPFEVAAGNDIVALRHKFPHMSMMGGIDKMEIARGKDAIDHELDKIEPLLAESGYFPALDHLIHPAISYADYLYFVTELRKRIIKCKK